MRTREKDRRPGNVGGRNLTFPEQFENVATPGYARGEEGEDDPPRRAEERYRKEQNGQHREDDERHWITAHGPPLKLVLLSVAPT